MKTINFSESRVPRGLIIVFIVIVVGLLGSYVGLRIWIKSDIEKFTASALRQHPGDKVEALISVLNSGNASLKEKNDAIWTLTYIGDSRALPVLRSLQTGQDCKHSSYVCQRGVKRAIGSIEGTSLNLMR